MTRRLRALARIRWLVFFVLLVVFGAAAYYVYERYWNPVVSVTRIVEAPVVHAFYATGTISPDREYPIRANVAGLITERLVDKGDTVKKDQPVVVITSDDITFKLDQAKAELKEKEQLADDKTSPILAEIDAKIVAADEVLALARRENKRIETLVKSNSATDQDLDRSLDRLSRAASDAASNRAQRATRKIQLDKDVDVARAALRIAQWNYDQQTIRSPINGVVLDWPVSQGTRVAVNDHLMQIADVSPGKLVMRAAVDEEDKVGVTPGQVVRMTLYSFPGEVLTGCVSKIYDKAESDRRTFEVDIQIDESDPHRAKLSPGMTGELAFVIEEKSKANILPSQAVQGGSVWIVREGRLKRAEVKLGLTSIERTEVLSGLSDDDQVVVSAVGNLEEGQRVRTQFVDPREAAGLNKHVKNADGFKGFR
ncbi:MAG: efflux RND transporter periplasmic adaptor subunit [Phycisphaeraceae bacterium]|nr:efflux RND transporter periplasmic adaptor subunit [Phycisphaeraceae bacterium]